MKTITLLLTSLVLFTSCTKDPLPPTQEKLYDWVYYTNLSFWTNDPNIEWTNPEAPASDYFYKTNGIKRFDTAYNLTEKQAYDKFKIDSVRVFVRRYGDPRSNIKTDLYKYCLYYRRPYGK